MIFYRITSSPWYGINHILDMVRYARAQLLKIENYEEKEDKSYIFAYLSGQSFFYSHIIPRWESFGCQVVVLKRSDELMKLVDDFEYHHGPWWSYDPEKFKVIWDLAYSEYQTTVVSKGLRTKSK